MPADARPNVLPRGGPRPVSTGNKPSPRPASEVPAGTKTLPLRRGVAARTEPVDAPRPTTDAVPDPFLRRLPAAPPAPAVESPAAEAACPRCGSRLISPESLGLCEKCGYCRSLEGSRLRPRVPDQTAAGKQRGRLGLVGVFESVGRLPDWFWVLLCGIGCTVVVSLLGHYLLPPKSQACALWSWGQLGVGILAVLLGQAWALVLVAPQDDRIGPMSLVFPARVWSLAFSRLPETHWPVWLGGWGLSLMLGAAFLVGGVTYLFEDRQTLPYEDALLMQMRPVNPALRTAAAGMDSNSKDSLMSEGRKGVRSLPDPGRDLVKEERRDDDRATTECVVIGYTKKEDGRTSGLILATLREGSLHYAGVVHHGLEGQLDRIQHQLQDLAQREEPIGDTDVRAIWIKPEVFVEVHASGFDAKGALQDPNIKGTLRSPENK